MVTVLATIFFVVKNPLKDVFFFYFLEIAVS